MMKKIVYILFIFLSVGQMDGFAQNANINFQISIVDRDGNLKDPVKDYGLTEADFSYMLRFESGCIATGNADSRLKCAPGMSYVMVDLQAFSSCGGWEGGDKMEMIVTINKPGTSLDGKSGTFKFLGAPSGRFFESTGEGLRIPLWVDISISVPDVTLCSGTAGTVTATVTGTEGAYTVTWSPEITASGADGTTGNIPASLTEGTYRATVTTAAGTAFKDFTVTVLPVPDKPGITLEAQQNAGERQLSFKVSNEPAEHGFAYSWFVNNREVQPGGERFVAENLRDGDVVVCKTVGGGECASGVVSDEFVVDHRQVARQAGEEYFVPNLITPNGDGLNDTWRLDWLQSHPKHLVTVYSSRGKMVYQSDHYQNDWDGRVNGKTTYGVFTYKIDLPGGVVLQSWVEVRPAHR